MGERRERELRKEREERNKGERGDYVGVWGSGVLDAWLACIARRACGQGAGLSPFGSAWQFFFLKNKQTAATKRKKRKQKNIYPS